MNFILPNTLISINKKDIRYNEKNFLLKKKKKKLKNKTFSKNHKSIIKTPIKNNVNLNEGKNNLHLNKDPNEIKILMMLPLFKEKSYLKHNNAIDFYIGAKAAINYLSKTKKINLKIFDTENNKEKIKNFFKKENNLSANVIIGPLFRSNIEEVAKISKNSKIPIISPFSNSNLLDKYTNIFQGKSKDESLIEPIFKEIKNNQHISNILYLIGDNNQNINYLKSLFLKEKISINIKILKSLSNIKNIKNPFFVILLSENPILGNLFIRDIQKFETDKIIPFGIGYNEAYYKYIEILKKYNFIFTVRYHINNKNYIYNLINKFPNNPNTLLNKYNFLGFDITLDTCQKILNNKLFTNNEYSIGLISKYKYEKLPYGGYINKGISVIKLRE